MEGFESAHAVPIAELVTEDKTIHTRYIGKMISTKENYIYWVGSCLGRDKNDAYFETFEDAANWVKKHIRPGVTLFEVDKF
jgi:hypothetical protein